MSTPQTQLQTAAAQQAVSKPVNTFRDVLEKMKPQIKLALPKHVDPDRMLRIVLTTVQRTPKLLDCTRESLLGCIVQCAQLGLEPDGLLGHAYLIPFFNRKANQMECQLIVGYKGLLKLARQSGEISSISARAVHEKDLFEYEYGLVEKLRHVPSTEEEPGQLIFAYAVFRLKDGSTHFDVMGWREIDAIRKRSKSADSGPWMTDYEEMAKKTVLRRASKMSPASIEDRMARALALDERAEAGISQDMDLPAGTNPLTGEVAQDAIEAKAEPVAEFIASTLRQRKEISKLCAEAGADENDVAEWFARQSLDELSRDQAEEAKRKLTEVLTAERERSAAEAIK